MNEKDWIKDRDEWDKTGMFKKTLIYMLRDLHRLEEGKKPIYENRFRRY